MRRTSEACKILVRHVVHLMEELRAHKVFVGHNTLYGSDDKLVLYARLEFFQVVFDVRRRSDENQCVVLFHDVVDIA